MTNNFDTLTVILGAPATGGAALTLTCTAAMVAHSAGDIVTFDAVTSGDVTTLSSQTGWTATSSLGWTSATPKRNNIANTFMNVSPQGVTFVVTPANTIPNGGTITLTASKSIWTAAGAVACTGANIASSASTASAGTAYDILTININGAGITGGSTVTLVCSASMVAHTPSDVVTFSAVTSHDVVAISAQTGWTVTSSIGWTSATATGGIHHEDTPSAVTFVVTPSAAIPIAGTITITDSEGLWNAAGAVTCTGITNTAASSATTNNFDTLTITLGAQANAGQVLTLVCTATMNVHGPADVVTFNAVTSVDVIAVTSQIGWTTTTNQPTAAPTSSPTTAEPTHAPTAAPTSAPTTAEPTTAPTSAPTTIHDYGAPIHKALDALGVNPTPHGRYNTGELRPPTPPPSPAPLKLASLVFCPNKCSGHGVCSGEANTYHACRCFVRKEYDESGRWTNEGTDVGVDNDNPSEAGFEGRLAAFNKHVPAFTGADCSERTCPSGMSWAAPLRADNDHTTRVECSGVGSCDRKTGACACAPPYTGVGCRRTECPNDCNGHGTCLDQAEIARAHSHYADLPEEATMYSTPHSSLETSLYTGAMYHEAFDSFMNFGCVCKGQFHGPDCSIKRCPSSDDTMGGRGRSHGRTCSGRGVCNEITGHCSCFRGYFGSTCETITALER